MKETTENFPGRVYPPNTTGSIRPSMIFLTAALLIFSLSFSSCRDAGVAEVEQVDPLVEKLIKDGKLPDGMNIEDLTIVEGGVTENSGKSSGEESATLASALDWESDFGTDLNQADDDCDLVNIGFDFEFYGNTYDKVWINSNGNMTFNGCNRDFNHPDVPDGKNVLVAPLYGDFNPSASGTVFHNTLGSAPNRVFVATWSEVPEYSSTPGPNTFQVQFFEDGNIIQFGYNGLSTDGLNWAFNLPSTDANMDVGISSGTGSFINSASGQAIPALDMTNICYTPDGSGNYTEFAGACRDINSAPVADAGPDQTVECTGDPTAVTLDGSGSSDPNGDPLTYSWSLGGSEIATGESPAVDLGLGSHTITLTVTDADGESDSDEVVVDIVDTTAPVLSHTVETTSLWPVNQRMVLAVSGISASDICDPDPSLSIDISSNEVVNGRGDGNTDSDWNIVDNGDGTYDVYLRAERSGRGGGRIYTVTATTEDASGNHDNQIIIISVGHDRGRR